jgi:outer membrane protein assembly factor BamB
MLKSPARIAFALSTTFALCAQFPVVMSRYNQAGTSADSRENTLNASNVNQARFGKLYGYYVDGSVFAQPLYLPAVPIPGRGARNVLYVATMNDKVYAFDADSSGPPLWMRSLTDEMAGVTPVPITDITNDNDLNIVGNVGIEGTPVIDAASNAIFLVACTRESGNYVQRIHKLDVRDGKDLLPATAIEASVPSTAKDAAGGNLRFDPKAGNQRPALTLVEGAVIVAWASHEDFRPYHGWVMAYDAETLRQRAAWCDTPDGADGGIWQSGRGPAVDAAGNIYFETGNGDWDGRRNFGTSLVKLRLAGDAFVLDDYFTPSDFQQLNDRDVDLGSTGPMLAPGTNLLIAGSKKGIVYLFDTAKLGHMTANAEGVLQTIQVNGGRIMAGPALWDGPAGRSVYLWCEADFLKGFRLSARSLGTTPFARGKIPKRGSPGGTLTVSSNGKQSGTGIVWATHTNNKSADAGNAPGVLRAFNAETLQEIWNSEQRPKRDRLGTLMKFVPPLVVVGKVYVPNYDGAVNVYGLLSP